MQIKEPLTIDQLLGLVEKVESQIDSDEEVKLTKEEASELCDSVRNFLMIKVLTSWRKK